MPRRSAPAARNSLRPLLVANGLIAAVIIAGIGVAYAWLSWKKDQRADRMRETAEAIQRLERQLQAKQVEMDEYLAGPPLRERVQSMGLGLVEIGENPSLISVRGYSAETYQLAKRHEK